MWIIQIWWGERIRVKKRRHGLGLNRMFPISVYKKDHSVSCVFLLFFFLLLFSSVSYCSFHCLQWFLCVVIFFSRSRGMRILGVPLLRTAVPLGSTYYLYQTFSFILCYPFVLSRVRENAAETGQCTGRRELSWSAWGSEVLFIAEAQWSLSSLRYCIEYGVMRRKFSWTHMSKCGTDCRLLADE